MQIPQCTSRRILIESQYKKPQLPVYVTDSMLYRYPAGEPLPQSRKKQDAATLGMNSNFCLNFTVTSTDLGTPFCDWRMWYAGTAKWILDSTPVSYRVY